MDSDFETALNSEGTHLDAADIISMPDKWEYPCGRRAVFGEQAAFQRDPHWGDHVPFYEYFHGASGRGVGTRHQTGWTGLVADLIQQQGERRTKAEQHEGAGMAAHTLHVIQDASKNVVAAVKGIVDGESEKAQDG